MTTCVLKSTSPQKIGLTSLQIKALWLSHGSCCTFQGKTCYTCSCPKSYTGVHPHTFFFLKHRLVHTGKDEENNQENNLALVLKSDSQEQSICISNLIVQALELSMLGPLLKVGKKVLSCSSTPPHFSIDEDHKMLLQMDIGTRGVRESQ